MTTGVLSPTACVESVYRVVIINAMQPRAAQRIREVVERKRGDLKLLCHRPSARPNQVDVHLGTRRLDDVLAALEGAGFDIAAVVTGR